MTDLGIFQAVVFGLSAFCAAAIAITLIGNNAHKRDQQNNSVAISGNALVFLIRDNRLIDANFAAHQYIDAFDQTGKGLPALRRALHTMFENAESLLVPATDGLRVSTVSRDGTMQASSETLGRTLRLKLNARSPGPTSTEDIHRLAAMESELETLRETTDSAPYLVWRETANGTPIWVNRAYIQVVREVFGADRAGRWPLPRLFDAPSSSPLQRDSLEVPGEPEPRWYVCSSVTIDDHRIFTAFDAGETVKAEAQLKEFMQTLAKTFAELTVGLAIFDRQRHLRLFNPALEQLTTIPAEFLAGRPKLTDFLDRLRENRVMPEPKNYKEWRRKIAELETAAETGSYSETWSLPGNVTYRVTGRPHPDGAIAFVFEDISAEISLTRQFRRELEISQALLDNMDDATAHFSRGGALVQTNRAYRELWAEDADYENKDTNLEEIDVVKASRTWHSATEPTPVWGDVREFVLDTGERAEWEADVKMRTGANLNCKFVPTAGGGSQVIFRLSDGGLPRRRRTLELVR